MRAAIYHRVSTADQHADNARAELAAAAALRGYNVVLNIEETGSGARRDRPGLRTLLEAVQRGDVDAVFVFELSRLSRVSVLDVLYIVEQLKNAGVRLVCTSQPIDVDPKRPNPLGELLLVVLAQLAKIEREQMRERTMLGIAAARRRGVNVGRQRKPINLGALRKASVKASPEELARRWKCGVSTIKRRMLEIGLVWRSRGPRFKRGQGSWRPISVENAPARAA